MEYKDGIAVYKMFESVHKAQLESSGVPDKFWLTLYNKLVKNVFDAGDAFSIFRIEYEEGEKKEEDPVRTVLVTKPDGIDCNDPTEIYLIDHAWTYDSNRAETDLMNIRGLLERMSNLMGLEMTEDTEKNVENVCREMWRYNQTYSPGFGTVENTIPLWYIMDEFGSAIEHSEDASFRCVPFYYVYEQSTYSILFPVRNIDNMEKVTRNYLEGPFAEDEYLKKALMIPWQPSLLLDVDYTLTEPEEKYLTETDETFVGDDGPEMVLDREKVFKVYSEYGLVNEYLRHPGFQMVTSLEEADVLWLTSHFKDFKKFREESPRKLINQFPCEEVLTMKDKLAVVCRRKRREKNVNSLSDNPDWFPLTYDLRNDLPKFVSCYQHREKEGLNNLWICKPWNLARGLDTLITDNLNCIVRLPASGPKLAQKYLENPVLFHRPEIGLVKFDIRYVVLLKSVKPLRVYAYRNFFLRFANAPFELRDFSNREKHYTVMNYQEGTPLFKMLSDEFVEKFEAQYPGENWRETEAKVFQALWEIFDAATSKAPPFGIGENYQSRALYAVDLMLSWKDDGSMGPKVLEVNWLPDCDRACRYYPTFFDDVFLLLFKDEYDDRKFQSLG